MKLTSSVEMLWILARDHVHTQRHEVNMTADGRVTRAECRVCEWDRQHGTNRLQLQSKPTETTAQTVPAPAQE